MQQTFKQPRFELYECMELKSIAGQEITKEEAYLWDRYYGEINMTHFAVDGDTPNGFQIAKTQILPRELESDENAI